MFKKEGAQWLVLSLSERKVMGSDSPMVVHSVQKPSVGPRLFGHIRIHRIHKVALSRAPYLSAENFILLLSSRLVGQKCLVGGRYQRATAVTARLLPQPNTKPPLITWPYHSTSMVSTPTIVINIKFRLQRLTLTRSCSLSRQELAHERKWSHESARDR